MKNKTENHDSKKFKDILMIIDKNVLQEILIDGIIIIIL